jgi:hypothetical protein
LPPRGGFEASSTHLYRGCIRDRFIDIDAEPVIQPLGRNTIDPCEKPTWHQLPRVFERCCRCRDPKEAQELR